jgi:hypothetical protein
MGFDVTVKEAPDLILRQTVAGGLDRFEDMVGFYRLRKKSLRSPALKRMDQSRDSFPER